MCEPTFPLSDMDNLAQQLKSVEVSSADAITYEGIILCTHICIHILHVHIHKSSC